MSLVVIEDGILLSGIATAAAGICGFFAWQMRYMMCEMRESLDRNTLVGEKILTLLEKT